MKRSVKYHIRGQNYCLLLKYTHKATLDKSLHKKLFLLIFGTIFPTLFCQLFYSRISSVLWREYKLVWILVRNFVRWVTGAVTVWTMDLICLVLHANMKGIVPHEKIGKRLRNSFGNNQGGGIGQKAVELWMVLALPRVAIYALGGGSAHQSQPWFHWNLYNHFSV